MRSPNGRSPLAWPGFFLGVALGGFFDGILLHQVLQWHHLLSNVDALQDLRLQVLADGLFHALMYVVGALALWRLWRARAAMAAPDAGRRLWGTAAVGFGAWHVADAVLSHWLTGIHRIRLDSPHPLAWDLAWFVVFGLVPLAIGWRTARSADRGEGGDRGSGRGAAVTLSLGVLAAGPLAAWPLQDATQVVVAFAPGLDSRAAFDALARVDARVQWVDRSGGVWVVNMAQPQEAWKLYRSGALLVSNTGVVAGCTTAMRVAAP